MNDPRIIGLKESLTILAELAKSWPEDIFGPPLSTEEWEQVRSAGIPTERVASECYRHALRVARSVIRDAVADYSEED
jgi:hypothetical protein